MSAAGAIYDSAASIITSDSGAGGLANSSFNGYIPRVLRSGERESNQQLPRIEIDVPGDAEIAPFNNRGIDTVVRIHIFTDRDQGHSIQNSASGRIYGLFNKVAPTVTGWTAAPCRRLRGFQAPGDLKTLHWVEEIQWLLKA
jgi:hypothetical protein